MEKKQQKEIIIMVVGVVILVAILAVNLIKSKPKTASSPAGAAVQTILQKTALPVAAPEMKEPGTAVSESDAQWGRDPFMLKEFGAGGVVEDSFASLTLEGTTAGDGIRPSAIINDEIVKEGSKIGKFTVLSIIKNKVIVTDGKDETELIIDR